MGVVTNAHVVKDGAVIKLIRLDSTKKYTATVLCSAVDIDLALLEVEDPGFWKNVEPIQLGNVLPELFTDVMVRAVQPLVQVGGWVCESCGGAWV